MQFRYDINFLRALSVLVVMFFHFQIPYFKGGFIGVDVFFVISGFLMTQIILKGLEKRSFSVKDFYIKRINRIIPALLVLLTFILVVSSFFFFESDLRLNAKYAFLSEFFISNIYYWKYLDYFTSKDNILLHTWSLGVEWQFYLLYPLILLILYKASKKNKRIFWGVLYFLTLLSFVLMLFITKVDNNFAFYMLPTRFWELSIGGIAFHLASRIKFEKKISIILFLVSIIAILGSVYYFSPKNLWPNWYTILPIFSTVLILVLNIEIPLLKNKIINFFGNISYSLYLWHWPWYVCFLYFGLIGWEFTFLLIGLSVFSAFLSYKYIESPKRISLNFVILFGSLITIFSVLLFVKPKITSKVSIYQNEKFQIGNYYANYESFRNEQFNQFGCYLSDQQGMDEFNQQKKCLVFDKNKKNVLLMGDSHAAQFSSSLREIDSFHLLEANAGFTFPFIKAKGKMNTIPLNKYIYEEFLPLHYQDIDLVILSLHTLMMENPYVNYSEEELINGLIDTIDFFDKRNINYLIIGQSETYIIPFPKVAMLKQFNMEEDSYLNLKALKLNEKLKSVLDSRNYVDIYLDPEISHIDNTGKIPYMIDSNHFSKFGADQVVRKILLPRITNILEVE